MNLIRYGLNQNPVYLLISRWHKLERFGTVIIAMFPNNYPSLFPTIGHFFSSISYLILEPSKSEINTITASRFLFHRFTTMTKQICGAVLAQWIRSRTLNREVPNSILLTSIGWRHFILTAYSLGKDLKPLVPHGCLLLSGLLSQWPG